MYTTTQEDFLNLLRTNPLKAPVYYEQDRLPKNHAFILVLKIDDEAKYADNIIYNLSTNIQVQLFTKSSSERDELSLWLSKILNTTAEYARDDFYYLTTFFTQVKFIG